MQHAAEWLLKGENLKNAADIDITGKKYQK